MKKLVSLLCVLLLLGAIALADGIYAPAPAGAIWYCPVCGRQNDSNFCPYDGSSRPASAVTQTPLYYGYYTATPVYPYYYSTPAPQYPAYTDFSYVTAYLNRKLASRTGPSTQYDEPGTFLNAGDAVTVLSKAYDERNEIWWVQVRFSTGKGVYQVYTGAKRFDNLNLNSVPTEKAIGSCTTAYSLTGYYGPGTDYAIIPRDVPAGVSCTIYAYAFALDGDYIQIEFYDSGLQRYRRAWVNDAYVTNYVTY